MPIDLNIYAWFRDEINNLIPENFFALFEWINLFELTCLIFRKHQNY